MITLTWLDAVPVCLELFLYVQFLQTIIIIEKFISIHIYYNYVLLLLLRRRSLVASTAVNVLMLKILSETKMLYHLGHQGCLSLSQIIGLLVIVIYQFYHLDRTCAILEPLTLLHFDYFTWPSRFLFINVYIFVSI